MSVKGGGLPPRHGLKNIKDDSISSLPESDFSRTSLQNKMTKLKDVLTKNETVFLKSLLKNGNEMEISTARERLEDSSIFGDIKKETTTGNGSTHSEDGSNHDKNRRGINRQGSQASLKQQEHKQLRVNCKSFEQLWRAHESGLSLTPSGSRISVMKRGLSNCLNKQNMTRNSSFLSAATQELLANGGPIRRPGEERIFRKQCDTDSFYSNEENQENIDNIDNIDFPNLDLLSNASPELSRPLVLNRMLSEGSRKSVTFDKNVVNPRESSLFRPKIARRQISADSLESFASIRRGNPIRSDSFSSFHSLHRSYPIRSESIGSFPSLHRSNPIRSESMNSFPSIHRSHPIRSDSMSSFPSIHRSHPIRSDSSIEKMSGKGRAPVWTSPLARRENIINSSQTEERELNVSKPMFTRKSSCNSFQGEIEVSYCNPEESNLHIARNFVRALSDISVISAQSWEERTDEEKINIELPTSLTMDDPFTNHPFIKSKITRKEESVFSLRSIADVDNDDDDRSWDMNSESDPETSNVWNVFNNPDAVDYGYGTGGLPFRILGTSANDVAARPHVLSPPLMESLQQFLPLQLSENNFWMKFSLVRDGASMNTLLQNVRGARHTILAIETADGEVFGSFTSAPWRKKTSYFGTGESFLWKMRQSRKKVCHSIIDQAQLESELDVYPWTGENNSVQLCTDRVFGIGGGTSESGIAEGEIDKGYGLAFDNDLLYGTSSPCATFNSPPLCLSHPNPFEIMNLELWTLTPCDTLEDAERLELGKLFLSTQ